MTSPSSAEGVGESDILSLDLPSDGTAARAARRRVESALDLWERLQLLDSLTLIASELVGNAVRHGEPPVSMSLTKLPAGVRIGVHDHLQAAYPVGTSALPDDDAEDGRGMFLVDALSTSNGVDHVHGDGKTIWAVVEAG